MFLFEKPLNIWHWERDYTLFDKLSFQNMIIPIHPIVVNWWKWSFRIGVENYKIGAAVQILETIRIGVENYKIGAAFQILETIRFILFCNDSFNKVN